MTLTPLHPLTPKTVPHVVAAAAKSPFLRGPGTTCHTTLNCVGSDHSENCPMRQTHHRAGFHVDVDPMIEDAWEAAVSSISNVIEGPSKALKDGSACISKMGEAVLKRFDHAAT